MTSRSDQPCIRGCVEAGVHYATCPSYGKADGECSGCAPEPVRDHALICDTCYRRLKGLLRDLPDLLGRMRSLTDPSRAAVFDRVRVATSVTKASAPLDDDLADAIRVVESVLDVWLAYAKDLDWIANHQHAVTWMLANVLDEHPAVHGIREGWSVLDAMRQWGVERRDPDHHVYPQGQDVWEETAQPVTEWNDPILTIRQAARRVERSQRAIQKWIADGDLEVAFRVKQPDNTVLRAVYASAVDAVAARMKPGRPPSAVRDAPKAVISPETRR